MKPARLFMRGYQPLQGGDVLRLGRMDSIEDLLVFTGPRPRLSGDEVGIRAAGGGDWWCRGPPGLVTHSPSRSDNGGVAHQDISSPSGGTESGPSGEQRAPLA